MSEERQQLGAAIFAVEAQRSVLGDAVVDALRAQLVALARPNSIDLAQTLKQVTILFLVVDSTARSRHSIAVFGANEAREDDADRI